MLIKTFIMAFLIVCNISTIGFASPYKYDSFFRRWGYYYFPWDDYHWWVVQGVAESNLNPMALSVAGAVGVMQIMPATATDLGVKNRWDAEESIQGGIKYDKQVDRFFKIIEQPERRKFMFAGYNAGMGNISKAKKLANSNIWDTVSTSLPLVTGKHSTETIGYVKRIYKLMKEL